MLARLKFDIKPLVNEILDKLPGHVWTDGKSTFLDPAMGGGQFVVEIERRLRENGCTTANIRRRVFGYENNQLRVNYAVNKNGLVGTYNVGGIEELERLKMQFDAIVANPPYQDTQTTGLVKSSNKKQWIEFVKLSFRLLKEGGYVGMITPTSWMAASPKKNKTSLLTLYTENDMLYLNTNCRSYFSGIGSQFSWYVIRNSPSTGQTKIQSPHVSAPFQISLRGRSFIPSILSPVAFSLVDKYLSPIEDNQLNVHWSSKTHTCKTTIVHTAPSSKYCYELFHTGKDSKWSAEKPDAYNVKKVVFTDSGYMSPVYDSGVRGTTQSGYWIPVKTKQEALSIISYLNSKLVKAIVLNICKWSGFSARVIFNRLRRVDFTRSWTDNELYEHFNLTQEEIDLIEATVK